MHRLAPAAAIVVRLGDCSPTSMLAKDRYYVIGVMLGLEIKQQWRISVHAQRGSGKNRALETVRRFFRQDTARGPCSVCKVIWSVVEKLLNAVGVFQAAEPPQFCRSEVV